MNNTDRLIVDDLRSTCNCPEQFTLLDFGGTVFGIFFMIDSIKRANRGEDGWAITEFCIGSIMAIIHATKFFYSKELGIK